jgi:aspartate/methionine/tyrosine aminotransferase
VVGWKVGWAIGPAVLVKRMHALHQYSVFSIATNLQDAIAIALSRADEPYNGYDSYYKWLAASYKAKRDYFVRALRDAPDLDPVVPDGAFYIMARHAAASEPSGDNSSVSDMAAKVSVLPTEIAKLVEDGLLNIDEDTVNRKDYNFCRRLALERQVVSIPPSAFFSKEHSHTDLASSYVRFAFSKEDAVLQESRRRLCKSDKGVALGP